MPTRNSSETPYQQTILNFGGRLKALRFLLSSEPLTQREMGYLMGVQLSAYYRFENGRSLPRTDRLIHFFSELMHCYPNVPVNTNWVMTGVGSPLLSSTLPGTAVPGATVDVLVIVEDGIIVSVAGYISEMTGYAADELLGKPSMGFLAFDSRVEVDRLISDDTELPYTASLIKKNGARHDIRVVGENLRWGNRKLRKLLILSEDQKVTKQPQTQSS